MKINWLMLRRTLSQIITYSTVFILVLNLSSCNYQLRGKQDKQNRNSNDKFSIGVFWPPVWEYSNDQQYQWLAEANVDFVENVNSAKMFGESYNLRLLELAANHGIRVSVADPRLLGTDKEIEEAVKSYMNHKALEGYYIKDEPDSLEFGWAAKIYQKILSIDPAHVPHLNLLPNFVIKNYETNHVEKWVTTVGKSNLKYLTFDQYPFMVSGNIRPTYFENLEIIRRVGLKYGVKTAAYLQAVGIIDAYKRPSESELRFNIYSALAYGVKRPVWFTYWTPTNAGKEVFTNAIMDPFGRKTDLYEPFRKLNKEVKQLGQILFQLDAIEVFHVGKETPHGALKLPSAYFIQPADQKDDFIISKFVDKEGKQFIMIVNKSLTVEQPINLLLKDDKIKKLTLYFIDKEKLMRKPVSMQQDRKFSLNLLPGEGKLIQLIP